MNEVEAVGPGAVAQPSSSEVAQALSAAADRLARWLDRYPRVQLLTGAGLSTGSGIGDYRDRDGVYKRPPPVTVQKFLADPRARQRYWARSLFGWPSFQAARPNAAHQTLAALNERWRPLPVITQNVDGLHQSAGHDAVLELHGNLHQVACLDCGRETPRQSLQLRLEAQNEHLLGVSATLAPDGDAELDLDSFDRVTVPDCEHCGGLLKPTVVFFGDAVPKPVVAEAFAAVERSDALLIVGSSVMIHSSFRFCRAAERLGLPMAAINIGRTRADDWLDAKFELPCEGLLPLVVERLLGERV